MTEDLTSAFPLLEAQELSFEADGKHLINQLSLTITSGKISVLMGANGAGKSLTMRLLHGLLKPHRGKLLWMGKPLDQAAQREQAMVFQKAVMLRRSVAANLRFALKTRVLEPIEREERVAEALRRARLEGLASRPARVLSGGEQQRLAIARALALRPTLLFLDEPSASLDPASTYAVESLIQQAHQDGVTVFMITHDLGQARRLADHVHFMDRGRVVESGTAADILNRPQSEPAKAWIEGRLFVPEKA